MAVYKNSEHWAAANFDIYGFRRADLKKLADKIGVNLDTPLDEIDPAKDLKNPEVFTKEDISILRNEISNLKDKIKKLTEERPALLGEYRKDDPLLLAIQIRNKDWVDYDPDNDRATRGSQDGIIKDLENQGFTNRQASSIEMVACPIKR